MKNVQDMYPLSPMQQGLFFHTLYAPGSGVYFEQFYCVLSGELDVAKFKQAWQRVVDRHEILRSALIWDGLDEPLQVVRERVELPWDEQDWRGISPDDQRARHESFLQADRRKGFELSRAPLMRMALIRIADETWRLVWSFHHVLFDGWSVPILLREVITLYEGLRLGFEAPLARPRPYRDYIAWLKQQDESRAEKFWRETLKGFTAPTRLGVERRSLSPITGNSYERQRIRVSPELTSRIQQLGRKHRVSMNSFLLGAWAILLSRYGGDDVVVFGATSSGRPPTLPGVESMVGLFVNSLPVRARVTGDSHLLPWLQKLQARQAELRQFEYSPLMSVQRWSEVPRGEPLFDSLFVFENYPLGRSMEASENKLAVLEIGSWSRTNFALTVIAGAPANELGIGISYERARFDDETVARMLGHLANLLEAMAAAPESRLGELSLLGEHERAQVAVSWPPGASVRRVDTDVARLLEDQAERTPDAVAVASDAVCLSYGELSARSNQLANDLRRLGVGDDGAVAVYLERSPAMVIAIVSVLKAGGAYVPLDLDYPTERLSFMLRDSGAAIVLSARALSQRLPEHDAEVVCLDDWEAAARCDRATLERVGTAENLAYIMYTSGSTGMPKGVAMPQRSLVNLVSWQGETSRRAGSRTLQFASLSFDVSFQEIFSTVCSGGTLVLVEEAIRRDAVRLKRFLDEEAVERLFVPFVALQQIAEAPADGGRVSPSLSEILTAGEQLQITPAVASWMERLGDAVLHNQYGPTESHVVSAEALTGAPRDWPALPPIGRPVPNARLVVLDRELSPLPAGVPGELHIGGTCLARGYLRRPRLTAEMFVPDPLGQKGGERLYRTGDLARWLPDGKLEFLGRVDGQVKIRGFRVELGEVEAVLGAHPAVQQAVVLAREDQPGHRRLVAYLVVDPESEPDAVGTGELRRYLQSKLPDYMVPAVFVIRDEMPRTASGKVDRRALPAPEAIRPELESAFVAPRTPREEALARIWMELLGIDRVGVHDNFFELGGDSILSIQVVTRASQADVSITPAELFQHPTIAELASVAGRTGRVAPEQGPVTGEVPLTPIQHWLLEQELPDPHHWNMALLLELGRRLETRALAGAVRQLPVHHDALRLRFEPTASGWRQRNAGLEESSRQVFLHIDLGGLAPAEQRPALEAAARRLQASLDLGAGPLMRVALFDRGSEPDRLLLVMHHLVVDGVSWRILLQDLLLGYEGLRAGRTPKLLPKTTSFKRWSELLVEYARSDAIAEEAEFWRDLARGEIARLPLDHPDGVNDVGSTESVVVSLDAAETRALLQEAPTAYRTQINDVLLTALVSTLGRWTGRPSLVFDLEGHGREELFEDLDLSRTVGWFTAMFPVRLDLEGAEGPGQVLKSVKNQLRAIPRRGIGYGILRYLRGDEELAAELRSISPEVSFNYLGQFDQALPESAPVGLAPESRGSSASLLGRRVHLLDVSGGVGGGQLHMSFMYSRNLHRRETVERLAAGFIESLRALVAHCRSEEAGGCTPSDFPLVRLEQRALDALVGTGRDVEDIYPLSPLQSGLLFHTLYRPGAWEYFEQLSCTFEGDLQVDAFKRAWARVVERHAILRTKFAWAGLEAPVQIVERQASLPWDEQDWRGTASPEQMERFSSLLRADRKRGFELERAPLMRFALIRVTDDTWRFVWSHHHLLLDGWSLQVLLREVMLFYAGLAAGQEFPLERPRPFREYIAWLGQQDRARAEEYWRRGLRGFTAPTRLEVERVVPPSIYEEGDELYGSEQVQLSGGMTSSLDALARRHQLTLNTLVQGAWALLLSRYSAERDVVFGTTVSGRAASLAGIESMLGLFINTLPVRVRVRESDEALPWLSALQAQQAELREFEHSALVDIHRWSDVPGGEPLFETLVVYENYPADRSLRQQPAGSLVVRDVAFPQRTNYPITLVAVPRTRALLRIMYDGRRFEAATVKRMLGHLETLLDGFSAGLERRLTELPMLRASERRQLLTDWNDTRRSFPRERCLHELFEEQAGARAAAVALVDGDQQWTYSYLDRRANELAHRLHGEGIGPEARVGLLMDRSPELIVGLLGILKAGGAYVPLDPELPESRLAFLESDSGLALVLTERAHRERAEAALQCPVLCLDGGGSRAERQEPPAPPSAVSPESLAYVMYTSGSSGRPKGVEVPHRAVVRLAYGLAPVSLGAEQTLIHLSTPSFDASTFEVWGALLHGARCVLFRPRVPEPPELRRVLLDQRVDTLWLTATLFNTMLEQAPHALGGVRQLLVGGEALSLPHVRRALHELRGTRLFNGYGPTESTTFTSCSPIPSELSTVSAVPLGRPIANTQVYVLDETLRLQPVGVQGELCIGGAGLARAYSAHPALTAEKFVPHPFGESPGERLYRSGDRCRWDGDGHLEFLGRLDAQVKLRGYRVELGEIEAALREHPAVRECAVTLHRHGPNDARLSAYLELSENAPTRPAASELATYLEERLPRYMLPASFELLARMPLTPGGKVDRRALSPAESRRESLALEHPYVAPRTPVEERLARIWSELLGVERVGVHDDFFELGGHSLIAIQLVSRLRDSFQAEVTLTELFAAPTIVELAALVRRGASRPLVPPVFPVSRDQPIPLSSGQKRLWFLDRLMPGSTSYSVPQAVRLRGNLNVRVLERTVQELVNRHEALRTTFETSEGQPVQIVSPPRRTSVPLSDLSRLDASAREREARFLAAQEAEQPFDLSRGPLFRIRLLRLDVNDHLVVLNAHHIVCDAWSITVLLREMSVLYPAFSLGLPSPLPELPVQYADFAHWQRQWLSGEAVRGEIEYWKERLSDCRQLELPTDRPRPALQSYRGAKRSFELSPELVASLERLSLQSNATLFMASLALFQLLLARYSGQEDIVVGSPVASRPRPEVEGVVGFFLNTLALRTDLSRDPTFRELLGRARATTLEAFDHSDLPFEVLVEELVSERDLSREPLIQVLFVTFSPQQTQLPESRAPGGLSLAPFPVESGTTKFDLTCFLTRHGGSLEYNLDLFDGTTIERMGAHLRSLMEAVASDPDRRLSELSLLTRPERHQLLEEWSRSRATAPQASGSLYALFERQVDRSPEAVALVFGEHQLSYAGLASRVDRLSRHLRDNMGVGPETRVGICMERGGQMIAALLAVLRAGGAYVPLDPQYPSDRLAFMLDDAEVGVSLTRRELSDRVPASRARPVYLDDDWSEPAAAGDRWSAPEAEPDNPAYVIYTSGSSGAPKGVAMGQRGLVNLIHWQIHGATGGSQARTLQFASLSFDVSFQEIFSTLCAGGTLVTMTESSRRDPAELLRCLDLDRVERLFVPFVALSQLAESAHGSRLVPRSLREIITAGEQLQTTPALRWLMEQLPEGRLHNQYGPTESHVVTALPLSRAPEEWSFLPPIGRPIWSADVYALDESLSPVPARVPGDLYLGGAALARGYLGLPELTAERFLPHPFSVDPGGRLYATGDRARWRADGNLEFLGRADDQVKIRGFRVEPAEVEAALATHPAVRQAAVVARRNQRNDNELVGYVVFDPHASELPKAGELRRHLSGTVPDYMVPSSFVTLDALPLTPSGKLDRRRLPAPERARPELEQVLVAPRTPLEAELARLWSEVLSIDLVGIHDDFFELGGHSLLATQLVSRMRDRFQVELPLRELFEARTVAGVAAVIERSNPELAAPPIVPVPRDRELPLSFAQQRLWFIDRLIPGKASYNLPAAVRLKGELDVVALRRTFDEILRRHEVLRTSFPLVDGRPVQLIAPSRGPNVPLIDLSSLDASSRASATAELAGAEAKTPFELSRGPLIRIRLLRLDELEHVVLLTMHHIVSDGWSMGVMTREVAVLYQAFSRGLPSPLPDLEVQYADFAYWQRQWLAGDVLEREMDYWKRQLEGMSTLALPTDRPRPAVQTFRGGKHTFGFPASLTSRLQLLRPGPDHTLFMVLLAAFQMLLSRYTGETDVSVGSPIANRTRSETEGLIGFFVNTLVLRNDLSGNPSFRQLLERTRPMCLEAYAHQDLPLEKLVDALQPARDMSRHPLIQVMFALQNAPMPSVELPSGLTLETVATDTQSAKFDLLVSAWSGRAGLVGFVEYSADLFDPSTITRMFRHFETLLSGAASNPEASMWELPLLSESERHQLLVEWNDPCVPPREAGCIHELFEEQVERTPDSVALVWEQQKLSYGELKRRADRIAHRLLESGVGPEVRVGICLERSLEMVVALLGVLKAGGAYVPLDPTYPKERLAFIVADAATSVILTSDALLGLLPETGAERISVETVYGAGQVSLPPCRGADASSIAYMIYTSGSTGRPKGVAISHANAVALLRWAHDVFGGERLDGVLAATSISFDLSVFEIFAPLTCGGRAVLARNALELSELGAASEVATVNTVPSAITELLRARGLPPSVRTVNLAGEPLTPALVAKLYELDSIESVYDLYGPSEDTTYSTFTRRRPEGPYSIGRPVTGTRAFVVDEELNLLPAGVPGELCLAGAGVARGYLDRPSLTAERFVPDPFGGDGGRLYRTGDVARWLGNGELEFQGRRDNQVKLRGYRIELGEIEAVLLEEPALREAVVVVREDESERRRLTAYVVLDSTDGGAAATVAALLSAAVRARLPEFMVPQEYVVLDALPLTPNGKVDRNALPAPESVRRGLNLSYVPPRTLEEEKLARVWSAVLGMERVGVHDNFFQLGGDSILSIQIVSQAQQENLLITPQQLFQHQTIAELALVAGKRAPIEAEQGEVTGPVPLTPIEHWFFGQDNPDPHYFNQALFLHLRQPLSAPHLMEAVRHIVAHHDALRLRVRRDGEAWTQHIAPISPGHERRCFVSVDLRALRGAETRTALEAAAARVQASLNLTSGPILRVVQFKIADGSERVLIAIHHIAVDGVSWRVLLQDLLTGYQGSLAGRPVRLPPKTTSIQQWARMLDAYANRESVAAEAHYWSSVCRSSAPLPTDHRGGNEWAATATIRVSLDAARTQALLLEVPSAYRTQVNDVLLTALVRAFAAWTSQRTLLVDLEGHGREDLFEEVDLTRTVGWFTTIFPVRLELGEGEGLGTSLMSVKEQLRRVPRRGIGYGLLRYLRKDPDLSERLASPAEVSFNYLGQLDRALPDELPLALAAESAGSNRSRKGTRSHLIDVSGAVAAGSLQMAFSYSRTMFDDETIQSLSSGYIEALQELIEHCLQPDAGGCTPSDFPLVELDQASLERVVGKGRDIEDLYPTTPIQAGSLFHSLYAPELGEYFEQMSLTVEGELDGDALKRAWQSTVDRVAVLRTAFAWEGLAAPLQLVYRRATIPWTERDLRGLSDDARCVELESFLAEDRRRGFELHRPPLMRFALIRLSERIWKFVWSFHHALLDGWSMSLLLKDVMLVYQGYAHGVEVPLDPPRSYRDYIEWLVRQDPDEAEAYWRETLRGFRAPTRLLTERFPGKRPDGEPDFDGAALPVSTELTASLQSMAREHRLNLSTVVEGAWALLLSRYSGEEDVVFGAGSSGRPPAIRGIETMLGFFMSVLPVRARMRPESSLLRWFSEHQARQARQREYEYSALVDIKNWSEIPRGQPLFEIAFVFENYPVDRSLTNTSPAGTLKIRDVLVRERFSYVLTLMVGGLAQEMSLRIMYDRRRYEPATVSRMLQHLHLLLQGIAARPEARWYELPMLTDAEREQLRATWNETETQYPRGSCVQDLFEEQAALVPDAIAVTGGAHSLSYRELDERANRLALYLRDFGVGPDHRVAIFVDRSPEVLIGALGVLKAAGAYVPLDPSTPTDRLDYMLRDSAAAVVLTTRALAERLADTEAKQVCLDAEWEGFAREGAEKPPSEATIQNLAYVIYTSGSTGRPKGVAITHEGLTNLVQWHRSRYGVEASDRATQLAGLSFDASVWEVWPYLAAGASIHLVDEKTRSSPTLLVEWLLERSITMTFLPTPLAESVLKESWPAEVPLRGVLTGGDQLHRAPESTLPFELWNHYGPTEDTVVSTQAVVSRDGERAPPIGGPIHNKRVHLLDQHGDTVPMGVTGELCIAGVGLARGYLGRPEWTAEKFVADPYSEMAGSRLYRTGDLVRFRPDGQMEFVGRGDQQVKIRGYRVELGEVEAVLAEERSVLQSAVVCELEPSGQKRLVGYVVRNRREGGSIREVREYLQRKLPEHMIPARIVELDEFPMTSSGKVDRQRLPRAEKTRDELGSAYVAPRNEVEGRIARLWSEVLQVERVGIHDNFFELGGHSLSALRLIAEMSALCDGSVTLQALFEGPTIAQIAGRFSEPRRTDAGSCLVPLRDSGSKPPLFFVHGGGGLLLNYAALMRALDPGRPFLGIQPWERPPGDGTFRSVEELAAIYVEAVRSRRPHGPYFLGGHSFGGVVAFEMAVQFVAASEEVALLAILDMVPPNLLDEEAMKILLSQESRRAENTILGDDAGELRRRMSEHSRRHLQALTAYRPTRLRGRVTLFRAKESHPLYTPEAKADPTLGWDGFAEEATEVHIVPGDHFSMLSEPEVRTLASEIQLCLDKNAR
jgi:amino acid adenylation domain-containing protein/non-ribosomal peptide synthase protein (TIGR01720 family)